MLAAAPGAAMPALALNISGPYLGTGVGAGLGGVLAVSRAAFIPLVGGLLLLAALALASGQATGHHQDASTDLGARCTTGPNRAGDRHHQETSARHPLCFI